MAIPSHHYGIPGVSSLIDFFSFLSVVSAVSLVLMVLACVEVGSNDATNLVNAVFGARIMSRRWAVIIAGLFVVLGATCASPVMNTVRKGIFDLTLFDASGAVSVFVASYLINTLLLFIYSAFGLPVSTTATLVFSLAGGAVGVTLNLGAVHWPVIGMVMVAIFVSILMSGVLGFLLQRTLRKVVGDVDEDHRVVLRHGPWITGLLLSALAWFMVIKGMKSLAVIQQLHHLIEPSGHGLLFLLILFVVIAVVTRIVLLSLGERGTSQLFKVTAVIGMACMAFAFGQNDLANCASPGIAILMIAREGLVQATEAQVSLWALFGCGLLMYLGMTTRRAQRVTRAEVNMASQQDRVRLYAPQWAISLARWVLRESSNDDGLGVGLKEDVGSKRDAAGKKIHYDALRASIILAVGACVIAVASSMGLPVSTTYVSFAAVLATGWGDKVFSHGRSDLKVGRAIWVVVSWWLAAMLAGIGCMLFAFIIYRFEQLGLLTLLVLNLGLRHVFKKVADRHEFEHHLRKQHPRVDRDLGCDQGSSRELHNQR